MPSDHNYADRTLEAEASHSTIVTAVLDLSLETVNLAEKDNSIFKEKSFKSKMYSLVFEANILFLFEKDQLNMLTLILNDNPFAFRPRSKMIENCYMH